MKGKPDVCPTCHRRHKRNTQQNRLYWAHLHEISDKLKVQGETYSADQWHIYFRSKFLGAIDVKLPNGKVIVQPLSTANLDVGEFVEYYDQVSHWAAEHGVWLPE